MTASSPRVVFAGTPEFAAASLAALLAEGLQIVAVYTQPDRPAGRGRNLKPSPVKELALAHDLPVLQPLSLREPAAQAELAALQPTLMIVAAYGLILPAAVLAMPRLGCVNVHASLLPRWRGAAPIERAIEASDTTTGITIMQMDAGLDTGAILLEESIAIGDDDTAQTLHDRLARIGARCIVRALRENPPSRAQDAGSATYAAKISKSEAAIDWSKSAIDICRLVRAFNPAPGAATAWDGTPLKVWRAEPLAEDAGAPGTVARTDASGLVVAAGKGAVKITELQKAGAKRLAAAAFLGGSTLVPGARLGT